MSESRVHGYTRPYTAAEDLDADVIALQDAGAHSVAVEASPTSGKVLATLIADAQRGDTLIVTTLERLGAGTAAVVRALGHLVERGVVFRALDGPALDTAAPDAVELLRALVEASHGVRSRATQDGMRRSGNRPGRPVVMTPEKTAMAVELRRLDRSTAHIAFVLGVSPSAVQRALAD